MLSYLLARLRLLLRSKPVTSPPVKFSMSADAAADVAKQIKDLG